MGLPCWATVDAVGDFQDCEARVATSAAGAFLAVEPPSASEKELAALAELWPVEFPLSLRFNRAFVERIVDSGIQAVTTDLADPLPSFGCLRATGERERSEISRAHEGNPDTSRDEDQINSRTSSRRMEKDPG